MNLIEVKQYLRARKIVSLQDMALHFKVDIETVRPLLEVWMGKGTIRKHAGTASKCKECCACGAAAMEIYEWMG